MLRQKYQALAPTIHILIFYLVYNVNIETFTPNKINRDTGQEVKPLTSSGMLAYALMICPNVPLDELAVVTGLSKSVIQKEILNLNQKLGGITGNATNGYKLEIKIRSHL